MSSAQALLTTTPSNLLVSHGGLSLNEFYQSSAQHTLHFKQYSQYCNKIRVNSNSLALAGSSQFQISGSSLMYGLKLNCAITLASGTVANSVGCFYNAIKSLDVTLASSTIQRLTVPGHMLQQWALLTCKTELERKRLLERGGKTFAGPGQIRGTIDVMWILQNASGLLGSDPLDLSTLSGGAVFFQIEWNPAYKFLAADSVGTFTAPTQFDYLELVANVVQLSEAPFEVSNRLKSYPDEYLPNRATYNNYVRYIETVTTGTEVVLNVNSAPQGIMKGILLFVSPASWIDPNSNGTGFPQVMSARLDSLRLTFESNDIFRADTHDELIGTLANVFDQDELYYELETLIQAKTAAAGGHIQEKSRNYIYFIPMTARGDEVVRGKRSDYLQQYGGKNLQLSFTVSANRPVYQSYATYPFAPTDVAQPSAVPYYIDLLFVVDAQLVINASGVDLVYH